MKYKNINIIVFYTLLALALTSYILGINNLSFLNTKWLGAHEITTDLLSWKFFKNDIWRFPLGNNPNFGLDIGSGIAFSGSIPVLAIIFKLFSNVLPDNFHYFGLWIFICLFLQSYLAFLIIFNHSENLYFSIIGSLFFLLSPILINRLGLHLSLSAHWLILMGFYLETKKEIINKNIYWAFLISLSSLIHFYFTIMLLGIFLIFFFHKIKNKFIFKNFFNQIFLIFGTLTFTMFVIGYFDVPFTDALAYGYGNYTLDVSGIINQNTSNIDGKISWSIFMPNMPPLSQEGFAYLGLGGILLLIFFIIIFISNFKIFIKEKNFFPFFLIVLIFSVVAVSNKIRLFGIPIFTFELPQTIYGLMSIVRASGRLFWPVYYLILLGSIILLYKKFSKRNSIYILSIIFLIQFVDISNALKKNFNADAFESEKKIIDFTFWENLINKNPTVRTTYLNNETKFLLELREVLLLKNAKRTDISTHGRYNRKQASISRSDLYKKFTQKQIPKNIIFAVDNYNHLRNLKYIFEKENVGFFFRNNIWVMVSGYKSQMSKDDIKLLEKYEPITLEENEEFYLNFGDEKSIHGLGWTHNNASNKKGIWTEGNFSHLIFKVNNNIHKNLMIKIKINSVITKKDDAIIFSIDVNDTQTKKFSLKNINELDEKSIFINVNKDIIEDNTVHIKFRVTNPVTKLELLKSPDARKLGILVKSLEIINK